MPDKPLQTPAGPLKIGARYNLTLKHGDSERVIKKAKIAVREQVERDLDAEGFAVGKRTELHYEATGMHQNAFPDDKKPQSEWRKYEEELTVGFLPENVVKAEPA
jgi:hypothetical protein